MFVQIRSALLFRLEMSVWFLILIWNLRVKCLAYVKHPFFHARNISRIRKYLSVENTKTLVHAFVTCRLDNGNGTAVRTSYWISHCKTSSCSELCCPFDSMQIAEIWPCNSFVDPALLPIIIIIIIIIIRKTGKVTEISRVRRKQQLIKIVKISL